MKVRVSFVSVLYAIFFALLLLIVAGTIIVFATNRAKPGENLRQSDPSPNGLESNFASFSEMGQIRALSSAGDNNEVQVTIILEPWFSYESDDIAFREELAGKRRKLRALITEYFNTHSYSYLKKGGEAVVKNDLLFLVNEELVLGKISAIYFDEYLFLE